jgi:hypothetical protein
MLGLLIGSSENPSKRVLGPHFPGGRKLNRLSFMAKLVVAVISWPNFGGGLS